MTALPNRPFEQARTEPDLNGLLVCKGITAVEQAVGKALEELRTPDEIVAAFDAWPDNSYAGLAPELLHWFWREKRLGEETLKRLLLNVWRLADSPTGPWCPASAWRAMFKTSGFLSDDVQKPKRPLVLYRGCTQKGRRGMSWTRRRDKADYFADYWFNHDQGERGHVYRTVAAPGDLLAIIYGEKKKINMGGKELEVRVKSEYEFVIDARKLPITVVETAKARFARLQREHARMVRLGVLPIEPLE